MKVRVCPKCGKHNSESAWHCVDCGTTLSMKTLIDMEDAPLSQGPVAGQPALSGISPHFEQDVVELLDTTIEGDESIVWGCNITKIVRSAPFTFGYLVLTSRRWICVQFTTEARRRTAYSAASLVANPLGLVAQEVAGSTFAPGRPCLEIWPTSMTRTPALAVDSPQHPLTPKERDSRQVTIRDLEDLSSGNLESIGYTDVSLMSLTARFRRGKEVKVAFYTPQAARETCKHLAAYLGA